jgi:hypothetical protein
MKLRPGNQRSHAMTVFEVFVVLTCLLILASLFLATFRARHRPSGVNCVSNIKQVNLAFRIWEGDNNNLYPMGVSVSNGGAMELIETGNVAGVFQVMSNELSTPKILVCPVDVERTSATDWNELNASHISYFIGMDVTNEEIPQMVLDGDDNFLIGGAPLKSGLAEFSSNSPIAWSDTRHKYVGNLGFADGSVQEESQNSMQQAFQQTGLATNRIAIP